MMTEEQKFEHTCDRVQNVIGECEWKVRDMIEQSGLDIDTRDCLLYTSPSPRDAHESRMPSSA